MLASRLVLKILAAYSALAVAFASLFAAVLANRLRDIADEQVERRLIDAAAVLAVEIEQDRRDDLASADWQPRFAALADRSDLRMTLVAENGTVLGDTEGDPAIMENHAGRPEIQAARQRGSETVTRTSATVRRPMMYHAVRLGNGDAPIGYVRVAVDVSAVEEQVASLRRLTWGTALAAALVMVAFTALVLGRIVKPLGRLTAAARAVEAGDRPPPLDIRRRDEIGELGAAFDAMSAAVANRVRELRRKGEQLEANSERLATVLGAMIEGVVAVDDRERILFANPAARALLELGGPGVVGRPLWEAIRSPTLQQVVRRALAGDARPDEGAVEFELPRSQAVVSLIATRLPGEPTPGVVLVLHDVTELRRLENLRREFVSNVSHELKTPLTSIQAYTETLLEGAIDEPETNRLFLSRIADQADRLNALIQDVLRLARIESGRDVFEVQPIEMKAIVEACVESHQPVAQSKGVDLFEEPPDEALKALADEEGLRTILDNLVDNAINYTPAGGTVTVRWRGDDATVRLEVEDTGVGIAPEHQGRIFERFYRVDRARSREVGGTGLGLSIVKHLATVFGGGVDVISRPGKGSRFTVQLPRAE
ncbi:MAG: ATP-binding protein [Planctomycetaceae bacterium]